jgi:hypothetical protein
MKSSQVDQQIVFDWKVLGAKMAGENVASVSLVMGFKVIFGGVRPVADVALVGAAFEVRLDVVKQAASGANFFGTQSAGEISFPVQVGC